MQEEFVDAFYLLLGLMAALTFCACLAQAGFALITWVSALARTPRHSKPMAKHTPTVGARR